MGKWQQRYSKSALSFLFLLIIGRLREGRGDKARQVVARVGNVYTVLERDVGKRRAWQQHHRLLTLFWKGAISCEGAN